MESPLESTLGARFGAYLDSALEYKKYRARVTRRIAKLRHELSLVTHDTAHYSEKQRAILSDDYEQDSRYGLLPLLMAERDLLYASEIKARMETTPNAASLKSLMVTRLKRAVSHCKNLLSLVTPNESHRHRHLLECYAYSALAIGQYSIAKKRWQDAVFAFSVARCAVDYLTAQASSDVDETNEAAEGFQGVLRELLLIIDVSLNLLASQTNEQYGDLTSLARNHCRDDCVPCLKPVLLLIESLDPHFVLPVTTSTTIVQEIHWRGHSASVYSDDIGYKLANIESLSKNANSNTVEADEYDGLIAAWLQVLQLHQSDCTTHDADDLQKVQAHAILLTYIQYNFLFTRLKRDTIILESLPHDNSRLRDASRVYAGMATVVREVQELPGVFSDEELFASLQSLLDYYTSQYQCTLAQLLSDAGRAIDSLRVLDHVSQREIPAFAVSFPYDLCTNDHVAQLRKQLSQRLVKAHILAQFAELSKTTLEKSMVESVYTITNGVLSTAVPLDRSHMIRPVSCKPVLFDIAYNYINYDLDKRGKVAPTTVDQSQESNAEKKRGFFGMFAGR